MNAHRKHKRPHPMTHRRRGISRKFAQVRTAGKGALVAFLVTVADLGLWNIGAAFWGLVAGIAVSWLLERGDFQATRR